MAASYSFAPDGVAGSTRPSASAFGTLNGRRTAQGILTITGTYTTGGDVVPVLAPVHQSTLTHVEFLDGVTSGGLVPRFDPATRKLALFKTGSALGNALQEVANGAALNDNLRVRIQGI
jgi:hypothetical protein